MSKYYSFRVRPIRGEGADPDQLPPSIESIILSWQALNRIDVAGAAAALERVFALTRSVFRARGILSDDHAKLILTGFMQRYDPLVSRQKAIAALIEHLERENRARVTIAASEILAAQSYQKNGLGSFEVEGARPEILAVNRYSKEQARKEKQSNVNSSIYNQQHPIDGATKTSGNICDQSAPEKPF